MKRNRERQELEHVWDMVISSYAEARMLEAQLASNVNSAILADLCNIHAKSFYSLLRRSKPFLPHSIIKPVGAVASSFDIARSKLSTAVKAEAAGDVNVSEGLRQQVLIEIKDDLVPEVEKLKATCEHIFNQ